MKIKVSQLQKGDVFRHNGYNFNLTVSDVDSSCIATEDMHPKYGEHIYFICDELDHEVTLVSYANPVHGRKHNYELICEEIQSGDDGHTPILQAKPQVHTKSLKRILLLCLKRALKDPAVGKFLREELYEMQHDWTDYTRNNVVEWLSEDHGWLATYFKKGNNLRINRMHAGHDDSAWWERNKEISQHNEISLLSD